MVTSEARSLIVPLLQEDNGDCDQEKNYGYAQTFHGLKTFYCEEHEVYIPLISFIFTIFTPVPSLAQSLSSHRLFLAHAKAEADARRMTGGGLAHKEKPRCAEQRGDLLAPG